MKISFVGSGNVATHLALAFSASGHSIVQICSPNIEHAAQLSSVVGADSLQKVSSLGDVDVCILAVSDDVIPSVVGELRPGCARLLLHTSGCAPIEVLRGVCDLYGVLWAPQTFVRGVAMDYSQLPFCIEGCSEEAVGLIQQLAMSVSRYCYCLDGAQRSWAHLCSVLVNNFVNALNASAQSLLQSKGIPFELLYPIIKTTMEKAMCDNVWLQQTGPAVRGDVATMSRHRGMLDGDEQLQSVYDAISDWIVMNKHKSKTVPCS
ncbi:MAG: DUF2520 domain-containing protein [Bacteroidales bacterium]|nr:DUF2520 domain-containing protein [Candidatus Colimorpha onthohippi]